MAAPSAGTKIVLQVGEELRIRNNGDLVVGNPELELAREDRAGRERLPEPQHQKPQIVHRV